MPTNNMRIPSSIWQLTNGNFSHTGCGLRRQVNVDFGVRVTHSLKPKGQATRQTPGGLTLDGSLRSEFYSRLKRNHSWAAVASQSDAEQAGRRRGRIGECSKTGLRGRSAGNTSENHAWQGEIRVIEDIEKLSVESQPYALS